MLEKDSIYFGVMHQEKYKECKDKRLGIMGILWPKVQVFLKNDSYWRKKASPETYSSK